MRISTPVIALASVRAYIARWPPGWLAKKIPVACIPDDLYYMLLEIEIRPRYIRLHVFV